MATNKSAQADRVGVKEFFRHFGRPVENAPEDVDEALTERVGAEIYAATLKKAFDVVKVTKDA